MAHEKDTNTWTTPASSVALYEKIKSNNIAPVEFATCMVALTKVIPPLAVGTCMQVLWMKRLILFTDSLWEQKGSWLLLQAWPSRLDGSDLPLR
jgi:hypothetical protein